MDKIEEKILDAKYNFWKASLLQKKAEMELDVIQSLAKKFKDEDEFQKELNEIEKKSKKEFKDLNKKIDALKDMEERSRDKESFTAIPSKKENRDKVRSQKLKEKGESAIQELEDAWHKTLEKLRKNTKK